MRKEGVLRWETAEEVDLKIAMRERALRRRKKMSQEELSELSGVSLGSLKRFETSGQISLLSLTKIAQALSADGKLSELFSDIAYEGIEEVLREKG